jgi:phytochrome-interacting factor 3
MYVSPAVHGWCRSDGNEFAELLWENGQAVVHGRRKQPQTVFPPFTCAGANSSKAQEKHPGSDPVALLKTSGVYGAGSMAPSAHDFCTGLDATRVNSDLDNTVPWIHYPIIEDDDDGDAAALLGSYSPDFFSELQEAAANLTSLPPVQHTANNRSTGAATMAREPEPSKESDRISAPATRPEPQAEFAAARQPRLGGGGDALMNFSLFSRPVAMARASLQQSVQRPPIPLGTDKLPNATVTASTRLDSTVVQTSSGPRIAPVCADQRTAWPQAKEVHFVCAAAPTSTAGIIQQELPQDRIANSTAPQRRVTEASKAPEASVVASSACSGNGAGIGNEESWRQQKRRSQAECSASQDDVSGLYQRQVI